MECDLTLTLKAKCHFKTNLHIFCIYFTKSRKLQLSTFMENGCIFERMFQVGMIHLEHFSSANSNSVIESMYFIIDNSVQS